MGKLIGGLIGLLLAAPLGLGLAGLAVGVLLGHQFDVGARSAGWQNFDFRSGFADPRRIRDVFFRTTFLIMGHIAKSDGRVSVDEIRAARNIMYRMRLSPEQVNQAIELFTRGKQPDFTLEATLESLRAACRGRAELARAFVEIQVQAAVGAASLHATEREILWRICQRLGLSRVQFAQVEALVRLQQGLDQRAARAAPAATPLADAYQVLGVPPKASDGEVKKAYRRLMSQHHPDKLVARGLPESMVDVAAEKTRRIRAAYESVRDARGMK